MRILIVEDELPAYRRLKQLLKELLPTAEFEEQLDTVRSAVHRLNQTPAPDLLFLDIQLADGLSFSIFDQVAVQTPVIFTTAFDQYTLQAFKVHSIDYLLKPIESDALQHAIEQFQQHYQQVPQSIDHQLLSQVVQQMQAPQYRERFLVKSGNALSYLRVPDIAYLYSEDGLVFARRVDGQRQLIDFSLDQLETQLSPTNFFRISRKAIIHLQSIQKIEPYFNGRLILSLQPDPEFQSTVSRDRTAAFKQWLDR